MNLHEGEVIRREIRCPACGRFLTMTALPYEVGPLRAYARLHCRGCGCWRWLDQVTGKERD